jgi:hypothetical protein
MKGDLEVYLGFYLIVMWFFRRSHLFSILIYWQLLRIRYMQDGLTARAF